MESTLTPDRRELTDNLARLQDQFVPPPPDGRQIEEWLNEREAPAAAWVSFGGDAAGPLLPALRPPTPGAPSRGALSYGALRMTFDLPRDLEIAADWQPEWRPAKPPAARGHRASREDHDAGRIKSPALEPCAALMATYAMRIEGRDSAWVHRHLRLRGEPELVARGRAAELGRPENPDRERSRSAERVIRVGDRYARALGAWPWAAFDDESLPLSAWRWWEDPRSERSLRAWSADALLRAEVQRSRAALELRRLDHKIATARARLATPGCGARG